MTSCQRNSRPHSLQVPSVGQERERSLFHAAMAPDWSYPQRGQVGFMGRSLWRVKPACARQIDQPLERLGCSDERHTGSQGAGNHRGSENRAQRVIAEHLSDCPAPPKDDPRQRCRNPDHRVREHRNVRSFRGGSPCGHPPDRACAEPKIDPAGGRNFGEFFVRCRAGSNFPEQDRRDDPGAPIDEGSPRVDGSHASGPARRGQDSENQPDGHARRCTDRYEGRP